MEVGKSIIILILMVTLGMLLPLGSVTHVTSSHTDINHNSVFISTVNGDVIHLQIDKNGVRQLWKKNYGAIERFESIKAVDLDNNGTQELLMVSPNDGLYMANAETGSLHWKYNLSSLNFDFESIDFGDLTGDGNKEILLTMNTKNVPGKPDKGIYVFNSEGNLLQTFSTKRFAIYKLGADNGIIGDLDNNGKNEIILSYGDSLFNRSSFTGSYRIESWEWDIANQNFSRRFVTTGPDWGGNTQIAYLNGQTNLVFTAGWYNNKVRAFDSNGTLIWDKKLIQSDKLLRLADTKLKIYKDENDKDHLIVVNNNYWENHTLYYYDIDPYTGEILNRFPIGSVGRIMLDLNVDDLILSYTKMDNATRYRAIENYSLNDGEVKSIIDDPNWFLYFTDRESHFTIILQNETYAFGQYKNQIWITNGEEKHPVSIPIGTNFKIFAEQGLYIEGGTYLNQYGNSGTNNVDVLNVFFIVLISTLLLVGSFIGINRFISDKFHKKFGNNWRELFKFQIKEIVYSKQKELRNNNQHYFEDNKLAPNHHQGQNLHEPSKEKSQNKIYDQNTVSVNQNEVIPVNPETESDIQHKLKPIVGIDSTTVYEFVNVHDNIATKVKIGDMAILIKILTEYPDPVQVKSIQNKIEFAKYDTLLNRIRLLESLNLIEEIENILQIDSRSKVVRLTDHGLQFLSIFYYS